MTLERLIANDERYPEGHKEAPVGEQVPVKRTVSGGAGRIRDLGHREHYQTMHRHFELRTRSETSEVRSDGRVAPGETAACVQRADGSMSIALVAPPAVPASQASVSGKVRRRTWRQELMIYHASATEISWPSGVRFARVGYAIEQPDPELPQTLVEVEGPPPNPRAAGTADIFGLRYMEATGEWWAFPLALGVASAEPTDDPIATPPGEGPTPPGEGGDDELPGEDGAPPPGQNPPEHDYVDPVTGEPLVPEQPDAKGGILVALHDGAISFSNDCGATWRKFGSSPQSPRGVSALSGVGTVIHSASDEKAWISEDLSSWRAVDLVSSIETEIPIENGDFEAGDLTGWTAIGEAPVVSDSTQPAQKLGSDNYLARDVLASVDFYQIEREVAIPVDAETIAISADVWIEAGSVQVWFAGEVEVSGFAVPPVPSPGGSVTNWDNVGDTHTRTDVMAEGPRVDAKWTTTSVDQYVYPHLLSDGTVILRHGGLLGGVPRKWTARVEFLDEIGNPTPITGSFTLTGINGDERIRVSNGNGVSSSPLPGSTLATAFVGASGDKEYSGAGGIVVQLKDVASFNLGFWLDDDQQVKINHRATSQVSQVLAVANSDADKQSQWQHIAASFQRPDNLTSARLVVYGTGPASGVFVDNVGLSQIQNRDESVRSVARDLSKRRHVIATESSLHALVGAGSGLVGALVAHLGPAPVPATVSAAHGDTIALSDGWAAVWLSSDDGEDFSEIATPSNVRQLLAHPRTIAICEGGEVVDLADGSTLSTLAPGAHVTHSSRLKAWVSTADDGTVSYSTDLLSWTSLAAQPQGGEGDRRTLPTDSGRMIGYADESKDLFHTDAPAESWNLSWSLTQAILDMTEVK